MTSRMFVGMGCVCALLAQASTSEAVSVGLADLAFSSFGYAEHLDQSNEFLGANGTAYDGLSLGSFLRGTTATITVSLTVGALFGSGDFEYLSVWIDWDRSRMWEPGEEVVDLDDHYFALGTNQLSFSVEVPQNAVLGDTWLRSRISFDGDLAPSGLAFTGEVEDYLINVSDQAAVISEPISVALMLVGLAVGSGAIRKGSRFRGRQRLIPDPHLF